MRTKSDVITGEERALVTVRFRVDRSVKLMPPTSSEDSSSTETTIPKSLEGRLGYRTLMAFRARIKGIVALEFVVGVSSAMSIDAAIPSVAFDREMMDGKELFKVFHNAGDSEIVFSNSSIRAIDCNT